MSRGIPERFWVSAASGFVSRRHGPCITGNGFSPLTTLGEEVVLLAGSKWQFPKIRGPQYKPDNTIALNNGTPKKLPLNWETLNLTP